MHTSLYGSKGLENQFSLRLGRYRCSLSQRVRLKLSARPSAQASESISSKPCVHEKARSQLCSSKRWYLHCSPSSLSWTWRAIDLKLFQSTKTPNNSFIIPPLSPGQVSGQLDMLTCLLRPCCWRPRIGPSRASCCLSAMVTYQCPYLQLFDISPSTLTCLVSLHTSTTFDTPWCLRTA